MRQRFAFAVALVVSCFSAAPSRSADRVFTGTTQITQDTYYQYDTITLDDAVLVTNGFRLTLEGKKRIALKGTPRIVDYEQRGKNGRGGGLVVIKTPLLDGTRLVVDNVGEDGASGANGAQGPKGPQGPQGGQRDWYPWNVCI